MTAKRRYPNWGAKKIRSRLPALFPGLHVPAASTIHLILDRHGAVKRRRRRRTVAESTTALSPPKRPNHVWGADFKGQFRLGDRSYCYPLTASDLFSRYLLRCEALASTAEEPAIEGFFDLFREYGLPDAIRSDNGVPFATTAQWGLSRLSVLWMRLGIEVQRIEPGCPQQNASHERMHLTMKTEAVRTAAKHLAARKRNSTTSCAVGAPPAFRSSAGFTNRVS